MLVVGDDWAEDRHDVEVMDVGGRRLARARLPEGVAGMARLHALLAEHAGDVDVEDVQVRVGIETDRGPWVAALIAAGYAVFAVNPLSVARFRDRHAVSGAKSDAGDAHVLADMVRTDAHQLRPVAGDSAEVEAIKVVARVHKTLIWDRTRHTLRLRSALREYFPAALVAFADLDAPDTLELLGRASDPDSAKRLSFNQIRGALARARRRDVDTKAAGIQAALRSEQLEQPAVVSSAYAATTRATIAILATLAEQIAVLQDEVEAHFGRHPDAEIVLSQPGIGTILGARVLAEFGDDPARYATAKARKNYAGTSPITIASGKKRSVHARHVHNDRLIDALQAQAFVAMRVSPGARTYYQRQRARGLTHNAALRQLANRLVGILHGCLKTRTHYNETTAWPQHHTAAA
ncbi:IS110 family transposase [Lentzea sp. NPDC051838]|uniref:IS110 family transposase n=1 Tax=Lentzea sp. NPDC051838 TaxID=3154849 RepID=UPI0034203864